MSISSILLFAILLVDLESVSAQCSLCPGGATFITNPNDVLVADSVLDESCGDIEADVASAADAECDAKLAETNIDINFSAFCCSDVQPSNFCEFCAGINIDEDQPIPLDLSPFIRTCGETAALAAYITGSESCIQLNNGVGKEVCCDPPATVEPTGNPTSVFSPRAPSSAPSTRAPTSSPMMNVPDAAPTPAPVGLVPLSSSAESLSVSTVAVLVIFACLIRV